MTSNEKAHKLDATTNGAPTVEAYKVEEAGITSDGTTIDTTDSGKPNADIMTFPDGGARAWSVAAGTAGVLFCTFGYTNAFG